MFGDLNILSGGLGSFTGLPTGEPTLRFGRMFPDLEQFRPPEENLIKLGQAMGASTVVDDNPSLPAGYTYLGQFIDHDITFDLTKSAPGGIVSVSSIKQGRTPSLDLDSLYGELPTSGNPVDFTRYQPDGIRLRVGQTKADSALKVYRKFENDLPRKSVDGPTAAIGDPRNDENLIVAQTALAFIKFHNAVVKRLEDEYSGKELFLEARRKVIEHYQGIVLTDFLPALIHPNILKVVLDEGCKHFRPTAGEEPFMPVEFSRAAFRIGHSQVRDEYDWNRFFRSPNQGGYFRPTLSFFLELTGFRGAQLLGNNRLPSTWIIDWTGFFSFAGFPDVPPNPLLNFTKKIDTSIAKQFTDLPVPPTWPTTHRSLAVVDLLRGSEVGLPTAQAIAERLNDAAPKNQKIRILTQDEIAGKHPEVRKFGFDKDTPLWYYVLREAEVLWKGERMGPVGSYLLAETFVGLIQASPISILKKEQDQRWQFDFGRDKDRFSMADLLYFVNDLNPLAKL